MFWQIIMEPNYSKFAKILHIPKQFYVYACSCRHYIMHLLYLSVGKENHTETIRMNDSIIEKEARSRKYLVKCKQFSIIFTIYLTLINFYQQPHELTASA